MDQQETPGPIDHEASFQQKMSQMDKDRFRASVERASETDDWGRVAENVPGEDIKEITYRMTEASGSGLTPEEVYTKAEELINQYYEQGWPEDLGPEDIDRILRMAESTYFFNEDIVPHLEEIAGTPAYNALKEVDAQEPWAKKHEAEIDAAATLATKMGKSEAPSGLTEFGQTNDDEVRDYLQAINPTRWSNDYLSTPQGALELYRFTQQLNDTDNNVLDFWRHAIVSKRQAQSAGR